jgi:hypothetical protein
MPAAVVHIGLPKTGTTSFQLACMQGRDALAKQGVLYPTDDWAMFPGASLHQALALRVANGTPASIEEDVARLRQAAEGFSTLLLSAERFAVMLNNPKNVAAMQTFREALQRHFGRVQFVCVVRSDRAILKSALREKIEGRGMPSDGADYVRKHVESFYRMNRAVTQALAGSLRALRFEKLIAEPFPASLLRACTGIDAGLPDLKTNASEQKDARRFLMSAVRMALFNVLGESTPYAPRIDAAYQRIFAGLHLDPTIDGEISRMLDEWMDRQLNEALATNADSLDSIYDLTPLVPPCTEAIRT